MNNSTLQEKIDRLLSSLEAQEPAIYELGTPRLVESDEVNQLVALGPQTVPYLLELLKSEKPKVAAYIALVLGKLGDDRALEPLRELRARYQDMPQKTQWDYSVIGQSNAAIDAIEATKGS